MNPSVVERAAHAIENGDWGHATMLELLAPSVVNDERIVAWWRRYERMSATPNAAAAMLRANQQIDVREIVGIIILPVGVLSKRDVSSTRRGLLLRRPDGGAWFWGLPGGDVFPYRGSGAVLAEIEEFVTGVRPMPPTDPSSPRSCSPMLSPRLNGATTGASHSDTLNAHNALASRLATRYGGRIVDTAGDGVLAVFDGPTRGIEYSRAFAEAAHDLGLRIRAGVHTGEVERRGHDLAGIGVHVGARVAALAGPDQVLVTNTVRELAFGSPASFTDHGDHELRGVSGTWHLYELDGTPS
jgi:hypothetical protein